MEKGYLDGAQNWKEQIEGRIAWIIRNCEDYSSVETLVADIEGHLKYMHQAMDEMHKCEASAAAVREIANCAEMLEK